MLVIALVIVLVYMVLAVSAIVLDQMSISCRWSVDTKCRIDDFIHLVFFNFHHFF